MSASPSSIAMSAGALVSEAIARQAGKDHRPSEPRQDGSPAPRAKRLQLVNAGAFARAVPSFDYVVEPMFARGNVYTICGHPGSGKTAVALNLAVSVALGSPFAGNPTNRGSVVYVVPENPPDVQARLLGLCAALDVDPEDLAERLYFLPEAFSMSDSVAEVTALINEVQPVLVIVDTDQATYGGTDENDNTMRVEHARLFRQFTLIESRPAVVVLSHPTKNASRDQLYPRGGGGFLGEIDGLLHLWKAEAANTAEMWRSPRKYRGPEFDPMTFGFEEVTHPDLVDPRGRPIPTIYAAALDQRDQLARDNAVSKELLKVLRDVSVTPHSGQKDRAARCGISQPTICRYMQELQDARLIEQDALQRSTFNVTFAGRRALAARSGQ